MTTAQKTAIALLKAKFTELSTKKHITKSVIKKFVPSFKGDYHALAIELATENLEEEVTPASIKKVCNEFGFTVDHIRTFPGLELSIYQGKKSCGIIGYSKTHNLYYYQQSVRSILQPIYYNQLINAVRRASAVNDVF